MRTLFVVSLMATVLFTSTYWYYSGASLCRYPIAYQIGSYDDRFGLTEAEARVAIHDAETAWEEAVGENLFNYDEDASFTVNFIFDDRQEMSDEEREARAELDAINAENRAVNEQYQTLRDEYEALQSEHQAAIERYEAQLAEHNEAVDAYNAEGGAPPEEFERLGEARAALNETAARIDTRSARLNEMADTINELGEAGNALVEQYNERVQQYNERYGDSREFTQGDYQGDRINIYTFTSGVELRQVLAHELGHALALGHVDDPQAVMYYLIGTQGESLDLTEADVAEFDRVCGDGPSLRSSVAHFIDQQFK